MVLLVAGGLGYWWWSTQQAATNGPLTASGAVEQTEYQIAPAMAGRIETVTVGEGDSVEAGAVIATLDKRALQLQLEQAVAGVSAAKAAVTQAKNDGTKAEVRAAKARVAQAQAAVQLAKVQLGYADVTAPHAGVVSAVAANAGQNASPGKTIATISDTNDLFVRVFVPETRIGDVKLGATGHRQDRLERRHVPRHRRVHRLAGRVHAQQRRDQGAARQARLRGAGPPRRHERHAQGRHARGRDVLA